MGYGTLEMTFLTVWSVYSIIFSKTLSSKTETATSVCANQCRIAINVPGLVEFCGRLCSLFYWIYFIVQLERTLES